MTKRVLIAGGGVAALEGALALNAISDERLEIELLGPEPYFWYRPLSVAEPFELGQTRHYELSRIAEAAGATFTLGALEAVDTARNVARTTAGEIAYDALLVAVGALPIPALAEALTFRGPSDTNRIRALLRDLQTGSVKKVAFAVPWGAGWSMPLYELALMTARHVRERSDSGDVEISLVTPEDQPLQLFGNAASGAVRDLLTEYGIELHLSTYPTALANGHLSLLPEGRLAVDCVVALPRLRGPRIDGLPQNVDGFVPIDAHGRVRGVDDVYAAGDITTFPIKQGGIATQLADAAAEAIAARLGADVRPEPFRPVLRGLLLTGGRPQYLRRALTGAGEVDSQGPEPLWWPPAKIAGRYLAPFLAGFAGLESAPEPTPADGMLEIAVEPAPEDLARLASPVPASFEGDYGTVADLMTEVFVVGPEETLGEVAEKMRERDVGSAAVSDYGRLVGILTARDLLRAFGARAHPSEARVREWMTAEPVSLPSTAALEVAVMLMNEHGIHQVPVVEGERPVGMLGYRQASSRLAGRGIGLGL